MLSVIVPSRTHETGWKRLIDDLAPLPPGSEVLVVGANLGEPPVSSLQIQVINSPQGRASQLNAGAAAASGEYLWFVHSDSEISAASIAELTALLERKPNRELWFFRLAFNEGGPLLMWLNAWGANFRSGVLGMPFGDQGFLIERTVFAELGGFDEGCAYGEDHLFAWSCRRNGVRLCMFHGTIVTSARKYQQHGWVRTTLLHLVLTAKQALPQLWRLKAGRNE